VLRVPESRGSWTAQVAGGRHWDRHGLIRRRRERRRHHRYPGRRLRRDGGCVGQNYGEKNCESGKRVGASLGWLVSSGRLHGRRRHVFAPESC
jgi:hypothetical protein